MPEEGEDFAKNVELSFKRAKKHITLLESEVRANREHIIGQTAQIKALFGKTNEILKENKALRLRIRELERVSTGNEGVYSNIHSFIQQTLGSQKGQKEAEIGEILESEPPEESSGAEIEDSGEIGEISGPEAEEAPEEPSEEEKGSESEEMPLEEPSIEDLAVDTNSQKLVGEEESMGEAESSPVSDLTSGVDASLAEALMQFGSVEKPELSEIETEEEEPELSEMKSGPVDPLKALSDGKKELFNKFSALSKQEFMTFLAIYQLEEDLGKVSYSDVASKLKLSEGCIRTYVSSLLRKGIPIVKKRINNKIIMLSVSSEFRDLGLKKEILEIYANSDPRDRAMNSHF